MRVVFMGTPAFAAVCLKALLETEVSVVGVYTKPDTPKNRGMKLIPSEVKVLALAENLPVFQPASFRETLQNCFCVSSSAKRSVDVNTASRWIQQFHRFVQ